MSKLEEILARFGSDIGIYDIDNFNTAVKELSTLIQQERREAVEEFVEWLNAKDFLFRDNMIMKLYKEYLNSIDKEALTLEMLDETEKTALKGKVKVAGKGESGLWVDKEMVESDETPEEKYETSKIIEDINEILVEGFATSPSRCLTCEARTPKEEIAEKREANLTHIHGIAEEIVSYVKAKGLEEAKKILSKPTPSSISSIKKEFEDGFTYMDSNKPPVKRVKLYATFDEIWNFFEPYLTHKDSGKEGKK